MARSNDYICLICEETCCGLNFPAYYWGDTTDRICEFCVEDAPEPELIVVESYPREGIA